MRRYLFRVLWIVVRPILLLIFAATLVILSFAGGFGIFGLAERDSTAVDFLWSPK